MALKSTEKERALLRARSAVQRFPVVEWRQRIEDFHRRSIIVSRQLARENSWRPSDGIGYLGPVDESDDWDAQAEIYPSHRGLSHSPTGPNSLDSSARASLEALVPITNEPISLYSAQESNRFSYASDDGDDLHATLDGISESHPTDYENFLERVNRMVARDRRRIPDPFLEGSSGRLRFGAHSRTESTESIASIVETKSNSPLNKAIASVSIFVAHE